jgi:hypothetical protein
MSTTDDPAGVDPNPDAGIGGDESETVPPDSAPPDEEGGGEDEDAEPAEVSESVGDAPLDDEDGSNDQGDAGGED